MRFLKLTDTELGRDILHVWIEDDCDRVLLSEILSLLENPRISTYRLTDRSYEVKP